MLLKLFVGDSCKVPHEILIHIEGFLPKKTYHAQLLALHKDGDDFWHNVDNMVREINWIHYFIPDYWQRVRRVRSWKELCMLVKRDIMPFGVICYVHQRWMFEANKDSWGAPPPWLIDRKPLSSYIRHAYRAYNQ